MTVTAGFRRRLVGLPGNAGGHRETRVCQAADVDLRDRRLLAAVRRPRAGSAAAARRGAAPYDVGLKIGLDGLSVRSIFLGEGAEGGGGVDGTLGGQVEKGSAARLHDLHVGDVAVGEDREHDGDRLCEAGLDLLVPEDPDLLLHAREVEVAPGVRAAGHAGSRRSELEARGLAGRRARLCGSRRRLLALPRATAAGRASSSCCSCASPARAAPSAVLLLLGRLQDLRRRLGSRGRGRRDGWRLDLRGRLRGSASAAREHDREAVRDEQGWSGRGRARVPRTRRPREARWATTEITNPARKTRVHPLALGDDAIDRLVHRFSPGSR